jgi:hypothetical protein
MSIPREVSRGQEDVEFRPVAGLEREFAGWALVRRSRVWDYLGLYPIGVYIVAMLVLIGSAI